MNKLYLIIIYFCIISIIAIFITLYDKSAAQRKKRRIPEKTLMLIGLFGGAIPMYIIMKLIHHKTKHRKFMVGLPLEAILHIIIITAVVYLKYR